MSNATVLLPANTALNGSFYDNTSSAIATSFPALWLPSQELISSFPDFEFKMWGTGNVRAQHWLL